MYKKFLSISLSLAILQTQVFAGITGTPQTQDSNALVQCKFKQSEDYYAVGDTRGNSILTKREEIRDCNITKTVQGECIKWKNEKATQNIPQEAYNGYDTKDYSDTVGSLFAATGAYDQMEHLWSGFRGYCVEGTLQDFDWASDPMFWAGLVMSYLMAGGEAGSVSEGVNQGLTETGKAAATEGTKEAAQTAAAEAVKQTATEAANEVYKNLGKCLVSGSYNLVTATANFMSDGSGAAAEDCDPIDEICEDEESKEDQSDIKTMDRTQFDDMVDSFAEEGKNLYDFVVIIDDGASTGIITFKMIKPSQAQGAQEMDNEAMEDLKEKIKLVNLAMDMSIAAGGMAACLYTGGSIGDGTSQKNAHDKGDDRASVDTAVNAAISLGSKLIPPPAGPIVGAVLKILYAFATSFTPVDSCNDKDDAEAQGSRHVKTQKSLQYNLCRPLYDTCEDEWLWGGCCLTGFNYCCYDQLLTKVLVEQIKAELGRGWSNCTGISLRDLKFISFRQCTEAEMADGLDGAHQYGMTKNPNSDNGNAVIGNKDYNQPIWDPQDAFQYKHTCMDLTEFKDYLQDILGENIDQDTFEDFWNNLQDKSPM